MEKTTVDAAVATRELRLIHQLLAERISPDECRRMIYGPDSDYETQVTELSQRQLVQTILWAMHAHASGYDPEDCCVVSGVDPDDGSQTFVIRCSPDTSCDSPLSPVVV